MSTPAADATPPRCYRHPDRETWIRCSRCDRPICPDCMVPASVGFQCPDDVAEGRRATPTARTAFGGVWRAGSDAVATKALVAVTVVVSLAAELVPRLDGLLWISAAQLYLGEWWRLLTPALVHGGLLHLAFNAYALWVTGPPLEAALGRSRLVALYVVSVLAGSAAFVALAPPFTPAVGASGGIFGLFGAFFVLSLRLKQDVRPILVLLVLNFALGLVVSRVAWQAHLGGLVGGALVAAVMVHAPRRHRALVQWTGTALVALAALATAGVAVSSLA